MTSNDSITTPEGTHMTTPHPGKRPEAPLTIPENVEVITIRRGATLKGCGRFYVTTKGVGWELTTTIADADLIARIHEIAAAMEAVK